ncbi:MAG: citrate/2-methylcitrate synthase [Thermodesulfobacteriota bacterium]
MPEDIPVLNTGLRGITIASTRISDVNGSAGKLIYRGFLIQELAESASFEEIVHLLLYETLPNADQLEILKGLISANRSISVRMIEALKTFPKHSRPMDLLQSGVAMLACYDPDIGDPSREAALRTAVRIIAKLPTIVAAWDRIRRDLKPVEPEIHLGHAANFLYMLTGRTPDDQIARILDTCLVLHAEHSFNASTFAAREVASTRAHMYASLSAAVGSLSGELHGGANERVMQMLMEIGSVEAVEPYVNRTLNAGEKIMGLGHAVYETDDPRALILAPLSKRLGERIGETRWYDISKAIEETGKALFFKKKGKEIYVNVDFYSASVYHAMGIPIDLFTPVFAVSRAAGWTAHVIEEHFGDVAKPVLYRPESEYVGDYCGPDECAFVPLEDR